MTTPRLVLVLSPRGGQGRTMLAANLAVTLARKGPVLLLDADWTSGGSLACAFDLEASEQGGSASLRHLGHCLVQPATLPKAIRTHSSGVRLVPAPPLGEGAPPSPRQVVGLVLEASRLGPQLVIDLSAPTLDLATQALLDYASPALLLVNPELASLQAAKAYLAALAALRVPPDRVQLVLNRVGVTEDISAEDVADHLGRPLLAQLPYHPAAVTAINRGVPLAAQGASPLSQKISQLASKIGGLPGITVGQTSQAILERDRTEDSAPAGDAVNPSTAVTALVPRDVGEPEAFPRIKPPVHQALVQELKELDLSLARLADASYRSQLKTTVAEAVARVLEGVLEDARVSLTRTERLRLIEEVTDEAIGYGPLERYLSDPAVTEIMVNGPHRIYVEKKGKLSLAPVRFTGEAQLRVVIDRIVAPIGRRVDESSPMCDARLPDGSRVNVVIPPLALTGSTLTIRKFPSSRLTMEHLLHFGSLSTEMARFLERCVRGRLNVFISGGTGSGKTTLLNVLSGFIPHDERIVTVEDAAELRLHQDHVVSLESRPSNLEGRGAITIRDLVRNALRMRPDRIIVGEVRGGEALDMLQAMNTGHDGSLATGHANSPRDALARLETMALMAGVELPVRAIREQIASAIHVIVQQNRMPDGSRKIVRVTEITGMEGELITLQDLFVFDQQGLDAQGRVLGTYRATGLHPLATERLEQFGLME